MPIRLQLLLFGVIGNILVAAIFIFSFGYRENIQEDSSNESLLTLYESAWYQTYNKSSHPPNCGWRKNALTPSQEHLRRHPDKMS